MTFIVKNAKLRKLLSRGPKYREPKQLDFISAKSEILKGIDNCIENYCDRYHLDKVVLKAWKVEIVKAIDERIDEVTPRLEFDPVTETLQDPSCRKSLLNLQPACDGVPIAFFHSIAHKIQLNGQMRTSMGSVPAIMH